MDGKSNILDIVRNDLTSLYHDFNITAGVLSLTSMNFSNIACQNTYLAKALNEV